MRQASHRLVRQLTISSHLRFKHNLEEIDRKIN